MAGGIRIIGGRHRGRRLKAPSDRRVRPTADRTREALFNILDSDGAIAGSCFLDLFCGTGAVGLEAYSRGADQVWLIDRDVSLASANVEMLDRPGSVHVSRRDSPHLGQAPARFDVVFLDPPYRSGLAEEALAALKADWLTEDALIVLELAAKEPFAPPPGFIIEKDRRYGAARLLFLRHCQEPSARRPS